MHEHRIAQLNAAAAERGLRPGIRRATALALAPELLLAESEPRREAAALQAVAHVALAFTPAVSLHDARTVLLEVQASLRLFGGLAALRVRLLAALAPLGHRVQMAAAPTARGAALLAQWHPRRPADLVLGPHATQLAALQTLLDAAPVALLMADLRPDAAEALQGMGLHRLADLRALPRSGVARRFGAALHEGLDRALGLQNDPRRWVETAAAFDSRIELFARADTTEQVLHGARLLLAQLVAWAQARHGRVAGFTLRMLHEKARHTAVPATELHLELAEPALDAKHLQGLLRERLGRLELIAPTLDLQLQCRQLVAGPAPNGELFPTRASRSVGLTRLLEQLRARLGDEQVLRLVPRADHRPEHATLGVPAQGAAAPAQPAALQSPASGPLMPLHRPAWLLGEPLALAERDAMPWLEGQPLQLVSGPERIESGWWDGAGVARDYFIALAADQSLLWIYRGRLPGLPGEPGWYLQGRFA